MEYQDVRCAAQVMAALQGSFLLSSDRGPIRIEYAKSKMAAEVGYLPLLNLYAACSGNLRMNGTFLAILITPIIILLISSSLLN